METEFVYLSKKRRMEVFFRSSLRPVRQVDKEKFSNVNSIHFVRILNH